MHPQPVKQNRENVDDKHTTTTIPKILGITQIRKKKINSEAFVIMDLQGADLN
jgi:hypothetical protein